MEASMTESDPAHRLEVVRNDKPNEPPYVLVEEGNLVSAAFQFLLFAYLRNFSPRTIRAYAYDMLAFHRFLQKGGIRPVDFEARHLVQFIQSQRKQKAAARTINRRLMVVRSFLNAQYDKRGDTVFPESLPVLYKGQRNTALLGKTWTKQKNRNSWKLKVPGCIITPLSAREIQTLLKRTKTYRDRAIVFLMIFCGLRSFEILGLTLNDIDIVEGTIRVCGKGNRERVLPLSRLVHKTLAAYLDYERSEECTHDKCFVLLKGRGKGQPMNLEALRRFFRHRRRSIKNIHPHLLRHTFCTHLMSHGVPIPVVQKLMGHADIQTTMAYTHIANSDVFKEYYKAMEALQETYGMDEK